MSETPQKPPIPPVAKGSLAVLGFMAVIAAWLAVQHGRPKHQPKIISADVVERADSSQSGEPGILTTTAPTIEPEPKLPEPPTDCEYDATWQLSKQQADGLIADRVTHFEIISEKHGWRSLIKWKGNVAFLDENTRTLTIKFSAPCWDDPDFTAVGRRELGEKTICVDTATGRKCEP